MTELVPAPGALARAVDGLDRLHPTSITDPAQIRDLLARMRDQHVTLRRGMNRRIDPELAWIEHLDADRMRLRTENFEPGRRDLIFLNGSVAGEPYFFSASFIRAAGDRLEVELPPIVYRTDRRGRVRRAPAADEGRRVRLEWASSHAVDGDIADVSPEGMAVLVPGSNPQDLARHLRVRFLEGASAGETAYGEIRHQKLLTRPGEWTRLGLEVAPAPRHLLQIEKRKVVRETTAAERAERRFRTLSAGVRVATGRALAAVGRRARLPEVEVVDYTNEVGERLRGIIDRWGDSRGGTAIVIPPAWGRTKETLMPLAATLVASFRTAGEPIVVLRYDGIRKRGESHNEPECLAPGTEHHRFTFSQGLRDIRASIDFLEKSPRFSPGRVVLVSFSAASIEARRAVATDPRIGGWICVVGGADAQSMMRVISGGVDYVAGVERGARFGLQEVLGVEVDIDHAGADLFAHRLPCLDDSRRDFAEIRVPVTWIHGRYDAWMDLDRVVDVMSRGDTRLRKLIEVPTGHMLKTSREALETFQLVATEASEMALGYAVKPALPDLGALERRQRAERARLPRQDDVALKGFWKRYLVGQDGGVGIELMTHTAPYRELMRAQIEALALQPGECVADLGSGTGAFPLHLVRHDSAVALKVIEVDFVREGLQRARSRLAGGAERNPLRVSFVEADLDIRRNRSIPVADGSVDAVLAGLFLSYVEDPVHLLREMRRILRPGGRLVLTSLRRDADVSKLYREGIAELQTQRMDQALSSSSQTLEEAARAYLNEASRLLDLEEAGRFRFWNADELEALVASAGFGETRAQTCFGSPPQAVLVSALRT